MKTKKTINVNGRDYIMKKSKYCANKSPVHVSDNMSGKMVNIPSISTSCLKNPICNARRKNGDSICSKCFAVATVNHYKALGVALESNYDLLTETILTADMLPKFKSTVEIVRIESFGDIANVTQAINYANICKANPHVTFAWWSKNMAIIKQAFDMIGKPSNVIMIESAPIIDKPIEKSNCYVDKTFTVFSSADKAPINCGARFCYGCRRCYKLETESEVYELLK